MTEKAEFKWGTLKIGAHRVKVIIEQEPQANNESVSGYWWPCSNKIVLDGDLAPSQMASAFFHEWAHVVVGPMELAQEEAIVNLVGEGLAALFVDNPDFVKRLADYLRGR